MNDNYDNAVDDRAITARLSDRERKLRRRSHGMRVVGRSTKSVLLPLIQRDIAERKRRGLPLPTGYLVHPSAGDDPLLKGGAPGQHKCRKRACQT